MGSDVSRLYLLGDVQNSHSCMIISSDGNTPANYAGYIFVAPPYNLHPLASPVDPVLLTAPSLRSDTVALTFDLSEALRRRGPGFLGMEKNL